MFNVTTTLSPSQDQLQHLFGALSCTIDGPGPFEVILYPTYDWTTKRAVEDPEMVLTLPCGLTFADAISNFEAEDFNIDDESVEYWKNALGDNFYTPGLNIKIDTEGINVFQAISKIGRDQTIYVNGYIYEKH